MAEKLSKIALKQELQRRIDWFEKSYRFNIDSSIYDMKDDFRRCEAFGVYKTLRDMKWQIENNLFLGGFAC